MSHLPQDIDITQPFRGSSFRNFERETIAHNIVLIHKWHSPTEWKPFTWEEYTKRCKHHVTQSELDILHCMSKEGWLTLSEGKFAVTPQFLKAIAPYAK